MKGNFRVCDVPQRSNSRSLTVPLCRRGSNPVAGNAAASAFGCLLLSGILLACNPAPPTDQQVQHAAARATVEARRGAKQAVVAAQAAAVVATRQMGNLAVGVREGMKEKEPLIDINSASRVTLATLPGVSLKKARAVVAGRPYTSSRQLVSKGVLTPSEYARVAPKISIR